MKTITVQLYTFNELTAETQQKVIDDHRSFYVDFETWDDYLIEDFTKTLEGCGLKSPKIEYTGFGSQGDGLSFTSPDVNLIELMKQSGDDKKHPEFYRYIKDGLLSYDAYIERTNRRYSHENSVSLEIRRLENEVDRDDEPELYNEIDRYLDDDYCCPEKSNVTALEKNLNDFIQRTARSFYKQLWEEYFEITSDRYIREMFEENQYYYFTADGEIAES